MPLIKSRTKKAPEMEATSEPSLAIAYSTKKAAAKKAMCAHGGPMKCEAGCYAAGGDVEEHYDSIADAILAKKKKAKMMADGGEVDLQENGDVSEMDEDASRHEPGSVFDDSQIDEEPEDSALTGDSEESDSENKDDEDMISAVRRKMKAKKNGAS